MTGYRDRYFTEALPALAARGQLPKARRRRLLFPATPLVSEAAIEAANAATAPPDNVPRSPWPNEATTAAPPPRRPPAALADAAGLAWEPAITQIGDQPIPAAAGEVSRSL